MIQIGDNLRCHVIPLQHDLALIVMGSKLKMEFVHVITSSILILTAAHSKLISHIQELGDLHCSIKK